MTDLGLIKNNKVSYEPKTQLPIGRDFPYLANRRENYYLILVGSALGSYRTVTSG